MNTNIKKSSLSSRNDLHLARKAFHIVMGSTVLAAYIKTDVDLRWVFTYLAFAIALTSFVIDFVRIRNPKFNDFVLKRMKLIIRKNEFDNYTGVPFFALGCGGTLYFFPDKIAILSILFLVFADPIASLIGILFGKDELVKGKSVQGFSAAFLTCFFISNFYMLSSGLDSIEVLIFSILAGVVGAVSELMSIWVDDNFSIPVFSAIGISFLNLFFAFV